MIPTEVPQFLKAYGFEELTLTNQDSSKKSYTFKFHTYNHSRLVKELGAPSITSDKKTAIFTIPKVGKLGVAPSAHVVRFIDASPTDLGVPSNHLSIKETNKELDFAYIKAQTTPRLRLSFLKKAYEYFNKEKFHDALKPCVLSVSASPPKNASSPKLKGARGIYYGGVGGPQGTLWIADFLFNSPAPFFNEVLVHEMCHQAVSTVDHVMDPTEGGHGPHWKAWMKKVGLDPRRYDPTDETIYKTAAENATTEEKDEKAYGPRSPKHLLDEVTKGPHPTPSQMAQGCECWYVVKGRALEGKIRGKVFTYTTHKGAVSTMVWKTTPQPLTFFIYNKA